MLNGGIIPTFIPGFRQLHSKLVTYDPPAQQFHQQDATNIPAIDQLLRERGIMAQLLKEKIFQTQARRKQIADAKGTERTSEEMWFN